MLQALGALTDNYQHANGKTMIAVLNAKARLKKL